MEADTRQAHIWWRRYEAAVRRLGDNAYEQAKLRHTLGEIHFRDGKYAEAADEENRAISAIAAAPEHQLELSRYYDALAKALERQGRLEQTLELHERALKIARDALGPSHPNVIKLQINHGWALLKRGQPARARSVLEEALASMPAKSRDASVDAGRLRGLLSDVAAMEGRLEDAAEQGRASLAIYQRVGAPENLLAEAHSNLGNVEQRRGHFAAALAMYQRALELRQRHLPDHIQVGVSEGSIADALVGLSRYDEAMTHVRAAERVFEHSSAHDRAMMAWIATVHGEALVGQQQLGAAISVLEQAISLFDSAAEPNNPPRAMWALARALHGLGKDPDRVRRLAAEAQVQFAKLGPPEARRRDAVERFIQRLSPVPASPGPRSDHRPTGQ
jgi:tetratricopeptide (TPR) repeat protein